MNAEVLFQQLKQPKVYGPAVTSVDVLQTHISYVLLTGDFAFKVKKPVNFGFLDFSTLEKRKHFCEEELRLNQRLCPEMYLEVVPITEYNHDIWMGGKGEVVEYAVKMKQFPQERIMTQMLKNGDVTKEDIKSICKRLVQFYTDYPSSEKIAGFGRLEAVKRNIDENFVQTTSKIGVTIPQEVFEDIKDVNGRFFKYKKEVFEQRRQAGFIHDCHGDLHSGNIVLADDLYIFDCIEFNQRFRFCDVASDIAFLAMDLDFLNHPFLSSYFISCYVDKSGDSTVSKVLNFYKSYRAYVRGKVTGFKLDDAQISERDKIEAQELAQRYFALSKYYSRLMDFELSQKKPVLFIVGGLTGTGKSTVAQKIAVDYQAVLVNTDVVRKEMAGIDKFEPYKDAFNTGLYTPNNIDKTYEQVIAKARSLLKQGRSAVLDATFVYQQHRDMAISLAKDLRLPLIILQCICKPELVKQRLEKRLMEKSVSDGRWAIYQQQIATMDSYSYKHNYMTFDTGKEIYAYRMKKFIELVDLVSQIGA